jgi:aspartate ammonia-lyase
VSALVKKALTEGKSIVQAIRDEKVLSDAELDRILEPRTLTRPNIRARGPGLRKRGPDPRAHK